MKRNAHNALPEDPEGRRSFVDLGVDGRIVLK
jgi:hypothetical protein